jgi:hypothetical protein
MEEGHRGIDEIGISEKKGDRSTRPPFFFGATSSFLTDFSE